ncbi:MAG: hypothetical protein ACFB2W_03280 [Leptolyngbyaceae cyanobacterium]
MTPSQAMMLSILGSGVYGLQIGEVRSHKRCLVSCDYAYTQEPSRRDTGLRSYTKNPALKPL